MTAIDRLERRFGRYAIAHLTLGLVLLQSLALVVHMIDKSALGALILIPSRVAAGEYWRLISFLAMPPSLDFLWAALALYMLYLFGSTLEKKWGDFRYNLFVLGGWLAIVATSWLHPQGQYGTQFLDLSVFLAFAYLVPEFELLIFFILPVKVRYLGIFTWVMLAVQVFTTSFAHKLQTLALVANFFLFFGRDLYLTIKQGRRQQRRQFQAVKQAVKPLAWHNCAVCGATEQTRPHDQFLVCSSCTEGREYCSDHLRQHQHQ